MTEICTSTLVFFFFNDTATTEIYTLSLHDALPIFDSLSMQGANAPEAATDVATTRLFYAHVAYEKYRQEFFDVFGFALDPRSEEHTSELQSRQYLVCRLLLEKKKHNKKLRTTTHSV